MTGFPIAEALGMSALSLIVMIGWFGYPLVTLVLCWLDKNSGIGQKISWTAFIIITWLFFAIGALVYGLVKHKGFYKLVPVFLVALSIYFGANMMNFASDVTNKVSVSSVSENIQDPARKEEILGHLKIMQEEGISIKNPSNQLLANYITMISIDDLTDDEYQEWIELFENRKTADPEKLIKKIQKDILEQNLNKNQETTRE